MITVEHIANKHHPCYHNQQTEFQIIYIQPASGIDVEEFTLSSLKGLQPSTEETVAPSCTTKQDPHKVNMHEWEQLMRGNFRESELSPVERKLPDEKYFRGRDLEGESARRALATRLHRNFGAPSWIRLSKILPAAKLPMKLYDERRARCENCKHISHCARAPLTGTSSIHLAREVGELITVGYMQFGQIYVIHIVDIFSRIAIAVPCTVGHQGSSELVTALYQWYRPCGIPIAMKLGNDSRFLSAELRSHCGKMQIFTMETGPYSRSGLAVVERKHQILKAHLRDLFKMQSGNELLFMTTEEIATIA